MAVSDNAWVFNTILWPFPIDIEHISEALDIKARVPQPFRVDSSAEGVLQEQDALFTLLCVGQGASVRRR